MGLNIKNDEVVRLANEVALLANETKTEAIRRALEERREKLVKSKRQPDIDMFLRTHIWPFIPAEMLGKPPLTREEEDEILGYGPEGF